MCTSASLKIGDHYFGRNLDLEYSYNETVVITPRNYTLPFRKKEDLKNHYAIIGMAYVVDNYPLYYDAANEKGLCMAGLNFPEAKYQEFHEKKDNITPFEFIPWILGKAGNVEEAKELIQNINLVNINYSDELPLSPLHWMISDENTTIVVECIDEIRVYENPVGVMTNSPSFDKQLFNLNNYRHLSPKTPPNNFTRNIDLKPYSRGMGGLGLPGDLSSMSRFVKAAFTHENIIPGKNELENVNQFFHLLESVYQQKGCCQVAQDKYEYTIYSSCVNTKKGIYYYKTYDNTRINAVKLYNYDIDSEKLGVYTLQKESDIKYQN